MTSRIVLICVLIVLGAVSGKSFCGKICPFGHIQRFLHKIPFPRKVKTFKLHMMLRRFKYAILVIGLLVFIVLLWIGIPIKEPVRNTGFDCKIVVGLVVFISICIVNYRPFCKYLCPVETMLSLGNIVPLYRYNIDEQKCSHCGLCAQVCKMNLEPNKKLHHMDCYHCGACKKACRKKAITSGINHISLRC